MATTKIEWADRVWNPVTGCTKVSEGCRNCYAKALHDMRHKAYLEGKKMPEQYAVPFEQVLCHENRLNDPFRWKKPSRVFVNSMSDLFHQDIHEKWVGIIWSKMLANPRQTFMVLTKRPERMRQIVSRLVEEGERKGLRPANNIWLGVSAENQQAADERIPLLLQTPAAVRFVSVEPMLGPVDFQLKDGSYMTDALTGWMTTASEPRQGNKLDWVICGGESGPHARPMHPDWARLLRDQCVEASVPFFFKQWGEWQLMNEMAYEPGRYYVDKDGANYQHVSKKAAGRLLDGKEWNEFPEVE